MGKGIINCNFVGLKLQKKYSAILLCNSNIHALQLVTLPFTSLGTTQKMLDINLIEHLWGRD